MNAVTAMKWVKVSNGRYATECGRFTISKTLRRGEYTLIDNATQDVCCPQYKKMQTVYNIEHGKNTAARWVRGVN